MPTYPNPTRIWNSKKAGDVTGSTITKINVLNRDKAEITRLFQLVYLDFWVSVTIRDGTEAEYKLFVQTDTGDLERMASHITKATNGTTKAEHDAAVAWGCTVVDELNRFQA